MRRAASVLVVVMAMAFSARAADAAPISFPAFTDPCSESGSTCTTSTFGLAEIGTYEGLLADTTFLSSGLMQAEAFTLTDLFINLSPQISIHYGPSGGCDPQSPCTPTVVPEPASVLLFGTGLAALASRLRHRRRRDA